jgi:orotidine-5'-phosphate decarboxylase
VNAATGPRLIVALDVPSAAAALALADRLAGECDFFKVGSELFTAAGPPVVEALVRRGADVFLDLKFHDIPNTLRGAVRSATAAGATLLTVHAAAGVDALVAAVEAADGRCGVLAVTVLTSLDGAALAVASGRRGVDVGKEVLRLAALARAAGAHGVVCAGTEAAAVRRRFGGDLAVLVPGVRPAGVPSHDQARVVTPREAVEAGASYLVLGRAVTEAADPAEALRAVRASLRVGVT